MNMQAIMRQAQKMQSDITKAKEEINNTLYEATSSIVTVKMKGDRTLVDVKIDSGSIDLDDIEMLQDMILVAINEVNKKIDKDTETKLGKYTQGMPGLF